MKIIEEEKSVLVCDQTLVEEELKNQQKVKKFEYIPPRPKAANILS